MLNKIVCMGRLVRDPELRKTASDISVVSFTIAVDRDYKNGDERVADFIPVTAWRGTADFISRNFSKGRMICVDGSLQTRNYEDKEGNKRSAFEIVAQNVYFADSKKSDGTAQAGQSYSAPSGGFTEVDPEQEGELPF